MIIKLTDTQKLLLSVAAKRGDRCLVMPMTLKGGVAKKVVAKLIDGALAKEIVAKPEMPVWRRDDETGRSYALRATSAGMKVVGTENVADGDHIALPGAAPTKTAAKASKTEDESARSKTRVVAKSRSAPRSGTKLAQVVALLTRDSGATLEQLVDATGWLPHTARAALTGLRKRGFAVSIDRSDKTRGGAYSIVRDSEPEPTSIGAQKEARPAPAARSRKSAPSATVRARKAA